MRDVYTLEAGFQEVKQIMFPMHLVRLSSVDSPADVFRRIVNSALRCHSGGPLRPCPNIKGKEEELNRDVPYLGYLKT